MNYIRQIIFEMRHQPLMTWLSIAGTAIAIFLIMSDFMIDRINMVEIAPESRRSRILYGFGADLSSGDGNSASSYLSFELAKELYSNLEGVERVSYSVSDVTPTSISLPGKIPTTLPVKYVDNEYWNIYDYNFEEGSPFSLEESEAGVCNAIITRSTAEKLFGKGESPIGKELLINRKSYTVTGVISNVNSIMNESYAEVFAPHSSMQIEKIIRMEYLGRFCPILLLEDDTETVNVQKQVEQRFKSFNARHKKDRVKLVYHSQPWDSETMAELIGTNATPDLSTKHRMRYIAYAILLLIPAINLSSMTRSRLRRRVSEIGLRRAFGCTRTRIISDLITENLFISLIGGAIGLMLSIGFIISFSNYFIQYGDWFCESIEQTAIRPSLSMLINWQIFVAVMIFCFLLNILSAGIPACKAAFTNPAEAISGHNFNQ